MIYKTMLASITLLFGSYAADAKEPNNLLAQLQPDIEYVSEPIVQDIPETIEVEVTPSISDQQLNCLARVIHHEARGEGLRGQRAVGYVVINRSNDRRFPSTICKVATQKHQFTNFSLGKHIKQYDHYYSLARELVSQYDNANDPTRGALYFHATYVKPSWGHRKKSTTTINRHVFYK